MTNKIKISIPEPCHENWLEMSPTEKGKFCNVCQKNVIDFTKSSDREIVLAYRNEEKLCGRFRISQLDREMIIPKEKKSIWMIAAASLLAFLGLGNQTVQAQGRARIEQTENKPIKDDKNRKSKKDLITYTGILYDSKGDPLPNATVTVKRSKIKTQTNFDGEFTIKAKKGAVLIFQYTGLPTTEFKPETYSKIKVKMNELFFVGDVTVVKPEDD
ncbi:carboxypeptidase-like regulatory domain-containing protein [Flavobacterium procerum]|uniref:Carboxypeptidase-like regulatory domain-containing protein n=1 Tax=Flavobacterium procerum TaxID=1455569 RepID=A0ABV6BP04_9FLAO